ncbi:hypothetical protein ACFSL4_10185 [Streptomyces caeni]|uniref:Uncharacterized protein n=1 Tax=Streptomyces caeni TaxID=2307231 RepID=A0ABW4IPZ3_9ACTN
MMRDGRDGAALRLLPWTTPEGALCYLSTDDPESLLSRLADRLEADLLDSARFILAEARPLLADEATGRRELRFTGVQPAAALADALRIAASRGERLPES